MERDEPLYTQHLNNLTTEQYKEVQAKLDTEQLLKFEDRRTPGNLGELLFYFFYLKYPTWWVNQSTSSISQTGPGRRRSVVDFYLIQKYYLRKPMDLEECATLYFTALSRARIEGTHQQQLSKDIHGSSNPKYTSQTRYYCSTVKRNVFTSQGINNLKDIIKFNKVLIDMKLSNYLIKYRKPVKEEFKERYLKAKKDALIAEKARLEQIKKQVAIDTVKFKELLDTKPQLKIIQEQLNSYPAWPLGKICVELSPTPKKRMYDEHTSIGYLDNDGLYKSTSVYAAIVSLRKNRPSDYSGYIQFEYVSVLEEKERLAQEEAAKAVSKTPIESVEF